MENKSKQNYHCGYVAIVGAPNVGKSTLINLIVGKKISAVTSKPQTTRHKIVGITTTDEYQIIFIDTPGVLQPAYLLHEVMLKQTKASIDNADSIIFMLDASLDERSDMNLQTTAFNILKKTDKNIIPVLNKADLLSQIILEKRTKYLKDLYGFKEIIPISAKNDEGTKGMMDIVVSTLPEHPPFYPSDMISEHSERFFVAEIIREKIFEKYQEEIPYSTTVDIVEFKEQEGRKDVINAEIYVEKDQQKGILIGKKGLALKAVGEEARKEIELFLERPVYLQLYVKVREKWREQQKWLKRLGYDNY
ncbi:MAG: GTPase Era [Ignavibacteriales bacterium]|nr:GTPase Era [Ignavibacteriales bacterium]